MKKTVLIILFVSLIVGFMLSPYYFEKWGLFVGAYVWGLLLPLIMNRLYTGNRLLEWLLILPMWASPLAATFILVFSHDLAWYWLFAAFPAYLCSYGGSKWTEDMGTRNTHAPGDAWV
jgi:hypothetical protein